MKRLPKYLLLLFIPIIVVTLFLLLNRNRSNKNDVKQTTSTEQLPVVKFAESTVVNSPLKIVYDIIKKEEFDKKNGIIVEGVEVPAAEGYRALLRGDVNIGPITPPNLTRANAASDNQKAKIFAIASFFDTHILTKNNYAYDGLESLKGRKLASLVPTAVPYEELLIVANDLGFNLEKDFEIISSPPAAHPTMLENDEVAGIITAETTVSRYIAEYGFKSAFHAGKYWGDNIRSLHPYVGLAVSDDWLANHKNEVVAFKKAWFEAVDHINNNINNLLNDSVFRTSIGLANETEADRLITILPESLKKSWSQNDIDETIQYLNILKEVGSIPPDANLNNFTLLE